MSNKATIYRCIELIERDHGGCDNTTCGIPVALRYGLPLVALSMWSDSGASDAEFDNNYDKLPSSHKFLGKTYEKERLEFVKIPHFECKCGSHIYEPEDCGYHCSSCGKSTKEFDNE